MTGFMASGLFAEKQQRIGPSCLIITRLATIAGNVEQYN
jgi:hypothetical protein